jgi:hypothetical protein
MARVLRGGEGRRRKGAYGRGRRLGKDKGVRGTVGTPAERKVGRTGEDVLLQSKMVMCGHENWTPDRSALFRRQRKAWKGSGCDGTTRLASAFGSQRASVVDVDGWTKEDLMGGDALHVTESHSSSELSLVWKDGLARSSEELVDCATTGCASRRAE